MKTAIIGTGFMGRVHLEGVRRLGNVEPVVVSLPVFVTFNKAFPWSLAPDATEEGIVSFENVSERAMNGAATVTPGPAVESESLEDGSITRANSA